MPNGGASALATSETTAPEDARDAILAHARSLGFQALGVASTEDAPADGEGLRAFIDRGYAGDMDWLPRTAERRVAPRALWPEARSVVVVGINYGPAHDPLRLLSARKRGIVSAYAQGRDYHDVLKGRLRRLARFVSGTFGAEVKLFVDTAPVMEKPLAARAGIGWQGKHTNLVSRRHGSWLFLGELFTTLELAPNDREDDHCGACRQCLDICPTGAFPAPYRLDARRCISYLTIEHKGHIAPEFREAMGNRIYGCDDCLAVCPWNKFARRTEEYAFLPRAELTAPRLADLAALDDKTFRTVFSGSPIKRIGRDRFVRNVLIAIGNCGDAAVWPAAKRLLGDPSPLVRAMAVWASQSLVPRADFVALRARHAPAETDPAVLAEWHGAEPATGASGDARP
ncbi:MAG: tRNA epoxyqueuosine(34) reductase QueG [Rhodospirillales bacterium]|nr:tRNA epoxyqueuosine(34) reductase QueG [Rhodospirillales bacterium]